MQKKLKIKELDLPEDDIECLDRYPKHKWVYEMSRLLDAQNVQWSFFKTANLSFKTSNTSFETDKNITYNSATIYINEPVGKRAISEVYITKGEIKLLRSLDTDTKEMLTDFAGGLELRISAFVSIHFQKFTGVISVHTCGNNIYSIQLKPSSELALVANDEALKLLRKIYRKTMLIS